VILSPQAKERLELQQEKYLNSLPLKKDRIMSCWQGIQVKGWNCTCLSDLKTEVHRLSGSAGSYGLEELGSAANALDRLFATTVDIPTVSDTIAGLIESLFSALDLAIADRDESGVRH